MQQFGLDRPLWEQYFIYFGNLVQASSASRSFQRAAGAEHRPARGAAEHDHPDFCGSLIIAYVFGVLAGAWLAWKRGSWIEGVVVPVVLATRAAPEFWLGMVLLAVFAFRLGWFPSGGANSPAPCLRRQLGPHLLARLPPASRRCRCSPSRSTCRACRCC